MISLEGKTPWLGIALSAFPKRYRDDLVAAKPFELQASPINCCENLLNKAERQKGGRS